MNRRILKLAVPNIISNISVPLLGMVDLVILGHLESEVYIGAIAIGGMIFNFIYICFGFLRMGSAGFTAQAYGKRDFREASLILARSLFVGIAFSIILIMLQRPIGIFSFSIINSSEEVESLARQYFYIRIWAAPATLGLYALTGWFIGMQNTKIPMWIAIVVNILNLGLNLFFIFVLKMKSDGVALGTVLAQYAGFIMALYIFRKHFRKLIKHWYIKAILEWKALKRFFDVNKDILIRTVCLIFTLSFFTIESAKISDTILVVNTLLFQYFLFFSYLIDGFAYAAEALTGKYIGSGNIKRLRKTVNQLFYWGLGISVLFTLTYVFAGDYILYILTDNQKVIRQTAPYMFWVGIIPLATFAAFIWDGIYIGATASATMRNSMLISTLLVFFPIYYIVKSSMGNHGLWLALMVFMASRGIFMTLFARKAIFKNV